MIHFPSKIWNETGMLAFSIFGQLLHVLASIVKQENALTIYLGKKEVKLVFIDNIEFCLELTQSSVGTEEVFQRTPKLFVNTECS